MSEAEATVKPVEAEQPEAPAAAAAVAEPVAEPVAAPVEAEKSEEVTEKAGAETDKAEEVTEKTEEKKAQEANNSKKLLKTTAQIDYDNLRNNRKFDPNTRQVTDDPEAIRKQVEFYFGDWNFPQDKFMWESCGGAENKPIKVKTIHSFKRMRTFQPYEAVIAALKDSKFLDLSGEEGEEEIKRKTPYKPQAAGKAKVEAASVYVKGFGDESPETQYELENFFAQFGDVAAVKLRRTNETLFKGSVFVTFANEEEAKKFIEMDPAPKYKDHDLKIMSKRAYCEEKNEMIRQGKLEPNANQPKRFYEGQENNIRGRRRDGNDWKARRDQDQRNGFRGRRGGGRGRGGRGRGGRGGRDDRRDDRRGRDDRNQEKRHGDANHNSNDTMPRIQSSEENRPETNKKRAREEEGAGTGDEPVAKKVDTKA